MLYCILCKKWEGWKLKSVLVAIHPDLQIDAQKGWLNIVLIEQKVNVLWAFSLTESLRHLQENEFIFIILDPILPIGYESREQYRSNCAGLDLLDKINRIKYGTQFIIFSKYLNDYNILRELASKQNVLAQVSPADSFVYESLREAVLHAAGK